MDLLMKWWKRNRTLRRDQMKKKQISIEDQIQVLVETIEYFEEQFQPHACGWMKTTISGCKKRIEVLKKKLSSNTTVWL